MTTSPADIDRALSTERGRAALLRCLGLLVGALEALAARTRVDGLPASDVEALLDAGPSLLPPIEEELRRLAATPDDSHRGLALTIAHVQEVRRAAAEQPLVTTGALLAVRDLADTHLSAGRGPAPSTGRTQIEASRAVTTVAFDEVLEAIVAEASGRGRPVHALNVEAGNHRITTEPRELLAALEAGEQSWASWTYFEARYGERGRRFTSSDSAWLVTLATRDPEAITGQIDWLAAILATRGMPRILLTDHLRNLEASLRRWMPEAEGRYDFLVEQADRLERRAAAAAGPETMRRWLSRLEGVAPVGTSAAQLMVSAMADHRDGIPGVLDSVAEWFGDPQRFDQTWTDAVDAVVGEAASTAARTP